VIDSWINFSCAIDNRADRPALVLLNVGVRDFVPDASRPALLWVAVYCRLPAGGACWDPSETEALDRLGEHLVTSVSNRLSARYVLHIDTPGIQEYFLYASAGDDLGGAVALTKQAFPDYRIDFDSTVDRKWERYLTFYDYAEDHYDPSD
jgi:hypothetical protein